MDESLSVALSVARILDALEVRWFLGGSLASSVHGVPRATLDADIVADLTPAHVKPLLRSLGNEWYMDEGAIRAAMESRSSFNLIHLGSAMKVDVFLPKLRRFDGGQFARASRTPITEEAGAEIPVCAAEDIIVAKLEWFRIGQETSERQWSDIVGVMRINKGGLNLELLRESSRELGVMDLLEKALAEA